MFIKLTEILTNHFLKGNENSGVRNLLNESEIFKDIYLRYISGKVIDEVLNGTLLRELKAGIDEENIKIAFGIDLLISVLEFLNINSPNELKSINDKVNALNKKYLENYSVQDHDFMEIKKYFLYFKELINRLNNLIINDIKTIFFIGQNDHLNYYKSIIGNLNGLLNANVNVITYQEVVPKYDKLLYLHISGHGSARMFDPSGGPNQRSINIEQFIEKLCGSIAIDYMSTLYCNTTDKHVKSIKVKYHTNFVNHTLHTLSLGSALLYSVGYFLGIITTHTNMADLGYLFTFLFSPAQKKTIIEGITHFNMIPFPGLFNGIPTHKTN
jgi:hypothetical protein